MKKKLGIVAVALLLSACGGQPSNSTSEPVTESASVATTEAETEETNSISLMDVRNWVVSDIWNKGFCDFSHYEADGLDSTGSEIDIDFAFSRFQKAYEKKPIYDEYMNSLSASNENLKEVWNKLSSEMEKLYEHYKNGVTQGAAPASTDLFDQYMTAFLEDIDSLEESESQTESDLEAVGNIDVDTNLFDVEITMPAEFVGETTQEELNAEAAENGYKVTLNEDGSATYRMTKQQHKKMMKETAESIDETLDSMIQSEDYPNIVKIETNDDYTSFIVTTTSEELSLSESFSTLGFYMYSGMYNTFNGTPVENVHVEFVNADSGEVISSSDSSEMNK